MFADTPALPFSSRDRVPRSHPRRAAARSLARLYTPLAMNGVQDGRQVVGPETVREFTTPTPSE